MQKEEESGLDRTDTGPREENVGAGNFTIAPAHSLPRIVDFLLLALIPFLYFYPAVLGTVILAPGDGWAQNFPVRALAAQILAKGALPIWNPFIFGGMPLMASVYGGAFYPPNWLFLLFPAKLAMNAVVITTYHLALFGTYLYSRRIGIDRAGALVAAIAFSYGGFMINHLAQTSRIAAAAWLPWVLLAIESLARAEGSRARCRWMALGACFIALQFLAGEPQMMVFTALVSAPCAAMALFRSGPPRRKMIFAFGAAWMALCGSLLCLIELLPARELLGYSERNDPGPLFFDTYSLPPWQLPALLFPYFFGGAMFPPYRVPYWGKEIPVIMSGYVGMLPWLLALVALLGPRRKPGILEVGDSRVATTNIDADDRGRIWLWSGIAVGSLLLAFGGYLPFELNHLLYRVPGYSAFRGLYRHQFEFTFAMGILAGLGMSRLRSRWLDRLPLRAAGGITALVLLVTILYRFFGKRLASVDPLPAGYNSLANPELLIPIAFFLLSLAALWWFKKAGTRLALLCLVALLLIDVASYGHFFHFPIAKFDVAARLADPPAVRLIKSREADWNSFRVFSQPMHAYDYAFEWPEDPNYEAINQPNISIFRGLQSVSGYDILRPVRVGEISGSAGSALNGFVQDYKSFGLEDRGLDLLNVKYLLVGHGGSTRASHGMSYEGIYFARTSFGVEFKAGVKMLSNGGGAEADEIAIVSSMANSAHLPDGAPVVKIRLHTIDGRILERELQAGRDSSEWALDRPDVLPVIKHQRARVAENLPGDGFEGHHYLGRISFDRARIQSVEWTYAREDASLYLIRASLHDAKTGASTPLAPFGFPTERWRRLDRFDQVEVFENLRVLPRAWFVAEVKTAKPEEILKTIRTGMLPEGRPFDPAQMALLEEPGSFSIQPPPDPPKLVRYEPNRIELAAKTAGQAFLVLSEVYFDGWQARIDGQPVKTYRTDYTLRGIEVPPGEHKIEFLYRPQSLRNGALGSLVGIVFLLLGYPMMRILAGSEARPLH
jgi:hypothetical protein